MIAGLQEAKNDTQFLLKRIDPSVSNNELRHNLMGEIYERDKWVRYTFPLVRDKGLLVEIMGMVERYVNPETRLSILSKDEIRGMAIDFGELLADLLFMKGNDLVTDPLDNLTEQETKEIKNLTKISPSYFKQIIISLTDYIYSNLTRAIDGKEGERVNEIVRIVENNNNKEGDGIMNLFKRNKNKNPEPVY